MKLKALLNFSPVLAIAIVGLTIWQKYQRFQVNRPDYEHPSKQARGLRPNPKSELAEVLKVHDGDTITVEQQSQKIKVRLCGIDAPELSQPMGEESRNHLRSLIPMNQQVTLYVSDTDRYGRKVAEVFIPAPTPEQPEQEKVLNYEMVRSGMAYRYDKYADQCPNGEVLAKAENLAKSQRLGVWSNPNAVKPWDYRWSKR